jgi:hypothetical protein
MPVSTASASSPTAAIGSAERKGERSHFVKPHCHTTSQACNHSGKKKTSFQGFMAALKTAINSRGRLLSSE